jgi:hypothetical protein
MQQRVAEHGIEVSDLLVVDFNTSVVSTSRNLIRDNSFAWRGQQYTQSQIEQSGQISIAPNRVNGALQCIRISIQYEKERAPDRPEEAWRKRSLKEKRYTVSEDEQWPTQRTGARDGAAAARTIDSFSRQCQISVHR